MSDPSPAAADGRPRRFGRVLTAMITPFTAEGDLDIDEAVRLAHWLLDNGSDGLVVTGTTGEVGTLGDSEKIELWRAIADAVTAPVIAGATSNATAHSLHLVAEAEAVGVAAILAVTPYYVRPAQAGIAAHFQAIAQATSLPVMLYDVPGRTGRKVDTDTMLSLARSEANIVAVKDAAGDPAETARLLALAPADFEVYSGDDAITLPLLSIGASGVVAVATHWAGPIFARMIAAYEKGDVLGAEAANRQLLDSYAFETQVDAPYPLPAKAMMRLLGFEVGTVRAPMGPEPDDLDQRAKHMLASLGDLAPTPAPRG